MIHFSRNFSAACSGAVIRAVRCEKCGCEYFYRLKRYGAARTSSPYGLDNQRAAAQARIIAERTLAKHLRYDVDPVRCPDCEWYQAHMVAEIYRRRFGWLRTTALTTMIVIPAIALCWMP